MNSPIDVIAFGHFRAAAATAAEYEMRVRLLADKTPALEQWSVAKNLHDVERPLIEHFAAALSAEEKQLLESVRVLRNKILHGEFTAARSKLEELGHPKQEPQLQVVKLPDQVTLEAFHAAVAEAQPFAVDAAPDRGHLFAWLIQLAADGSLAAAATAFAKARDVINRLAMLDAEAQP